MKLESLSRRKQNFTMNHYHRKIRKCKEGVKNSTREIRERVQMELAGNKQSHHEKEKVFGANKATLKVRWMYSGFKDRIKMRSHLDYIPFEMGPNRTGKLVAVTIC